MLSAIVDFLTFIRRINNCFLDLKPETYINSNKYGMARNWGNQNPSSTLKTKTEKNKINYKLSKYKEK